MLGALTYRDKDVIKTLAILSTLRGEDSAGALIVPRKGGAPISMKTVGTSFDLFNLSLWEKTSFYDKQAVIGHTRKATIGGITKSAAHPFSYDHIHGVHNGTLQRWTALPCGAEVSDSATAYRSMAELGVRETVERLGGAYAFVFYDETAGTINFLRNNERPLFYAFSEDYSKVIWASEHWMLWAACSKEGWKMANLAKEGETPEYIVSVEVNQWIRIKVKETGVKDVITFLEDEELIGDVIKPEVKTYSHPFHSHGQGSNHRVPFDYEKRKENEAKPLALAPPDTTPTVAGSANTPASSQVPSRTTSTSPASRPPRPTLSLVAGNNASGSKPSSESSKTLDLVIPDNLDDPLPASLRVVLDINGMPMSREAFEEITDSKCCFCGTDVDYEDAIEHAGGAISIPGIGLWADRERFVCTHCVPSAR